MDKVKANMKKIHDAICKRTVKLYFRGNAGVEGEPTDLPIAEPWSPDGAMHKGDYFVRGLARATAGVRSDQDPYVAR